MHACCTCAQMHVHIDVHQSASLTITDRRDMAIAHLLNHGMDGMAARPCSTLASADVAHSSTQHWTHPRSPIQRDQGLVLSWVEWLMPISTKQLPVHAHSADSCLHTTRAVPLPRGRQPTLTRDHALLLHTL